MERIIMQAAPAIVCERYPIGMQDGTEYINKFYYATAPHGCVEVRVAKAGFRKAGFVVEVSSASHNCDAGSAVLWA